MNRDDGPDYSSVLAKLSTLALYIVSGTGITVAAIGYLLIRFGDYTRIENILFRNILFILGLLELVAVQVYKKMSLGRTDLSVNEPEMLYKKLAPMTVVIAAMCSSISIYGLIATLLGSSYEVLLLFVVISLIGYQIFRIRNRDLNRPGG